MCSKGQLSDIPLKIYFWIPPDYTPQMDTEIAVSLVRRETTSWILQTGK
jgi:hypothetical protein